MTNWPERYLALADFISGWSKDPSTKVGAVLFRLDGSIISMGYNGFPRGVDDDPALLADRSVKLKMTIHAEENAILAAVRNGSTVEGASLAVTRHPCSQCAAKLSQAGIQQVYYLVDEAFQARWADDVELAQNMFDQLRVLCVPMSLEGNRSV
jgi:dCMP deaminase